MAESDVSTQASCRLASAELEWISGVVTDSRRGVYGDDWSRMDLARSDSEIPLQKSLVFLKMQPLGERPCRHIGWDHPPACVGGVKGKLATKCGYYSIDEKQEPTAAQALPGHSQHHSGGDTCDENGLSGCMSLYTWRCFVF
ncbi:hypothetical protein J7T55_014837 [Diaporthe amygdali]|uniref:uncharacterized protein n=1 Tax=Phomopsis amygdali TaxID=1214568 RepID=UPI0022FF1219|nr:uncharacterized protein J7T55_014837 [Diaporthe amygdali]KAJ0110034.1 hypothetical protein J7T55_014837 [Diaporthe amygdali]